MKYTGKQLESNTQDRSTPDPGKVEGPLFCGVCGEEMDVKRNVNGPRGSVQAMSGGKSPHDVFTCPHREEQWHEQVVALRKEAKKTPSAKLEKLLLEEAEEILQSKECTKGEGFSLFGYHLGL